MMFKLVRNSKLHFCPIIFQRNSLNFQRISPFSTQNNNNSHITANTTDLEANFKRLLNSIDGVKKLEPNELITLIAYLKKYNVSESKDINLIIEKCFMINNPDLHHALEENLNVKLRITDAIKELKESTEQEEFEIQRKKFLKKMSLLFKLFIGSVLLTTAFRAYFYLEYEVDPLHPKVSDYLLYRFK